MPFSVLHIDGAVKIIFMACSVYLVASALIFFTYGHQIERNGEEDLPAESQRCPQALAVAMPHSREAARCRSGALLPGAVSRRGCALLGPSRPRERPRQGVVGQGLGRGSGAGRGRRRTRPAEAEAAPEGLTQALSCSPPLLLSAALPPLVTAGWFDS